MRNVKALDTDNINFTISGSRTTQYIQRTF